MLLLESLLGKEKKKEKKAASYRIPQGILSLALAAESGGEELVGGATEDDSRWLGALVALPLLQN